MRLLEGKEVDQDLVLGPKSNREIEAGNRSKWRGKRWALGCLMSGTEQQVEEEVRRLTNLQKAFDSLARSSSCCLLSLVSSLLTPVSCLRSPVVAEVTREGSGGSVVTGPVQDSTVEC
jgi:hypothetical protein